jgi:anaerobic ribonucleoside-triphosphate reductase activating protein
MARVPNEPKLLEFLQELDVLVDGLFVLAKRYDDNDMHGKFKGSSNQRIIDVKKSLENNKVVLSKYDT